MKRDGMAAGGNASTVRSRYLLEGRARKGAKKMTCSAPGKPARGRDASRGCAVQASQAAASASRSQNSIRCALGMAIAPARLNAVSVRQTVSIVRPR